MPPQKEQWHLDKRLSVGHLITTISVAASVGIWASLIDTRLALLEQRAQLQVALDKRQDDDNQRMYQEILNRLSRMDDKLDRLNERTPPKGN